MSSVTNVRIYIFLENCFYWVLVSLSLSLFDKYLTNGSIHLKLWEHYYFSCPSECSSTVAHFGYLLYKMVHFARWVISAIHNFAFVFFHRKHILFHKIFNIESLSSSPWTKAQFNSSVAVYIIMIHQSC